MINLSVIRDLTLTVGAAAVTAMVADDVLGLPVRPQRHTSTELPVTAHGWLFQADAFGADRARRLRPATAAEAAASTASRIAGNGGWFGLSRTGDLIDIEDVRFAPAGREFGPDAIDPVFVPQTTTTTTTVPPTVLPVTARNTGQTGETVRLTADVVLFAIDDSEPHVLLIRRDRPPFAGCWALPGGHVDPGEQVEDTAHRELAEETGIHTGALHPVGIYSDPGRDPRGRYVTWAYTATLPALVEPTAGDDAADARWIPLADALADGLAFDHDRILTDALAVTGVVTG